MTQVTVLLEAARRGETGAMDQLFGLLYEDLHQLAHARLRRSGTLTLLDTTALMHESYLRLFMGMPRASCDPSWWISCGGAWPSGAAALSRCGADVIRCVTASKPARVPAGVCIKGSGDGEVRT